MASFEEQLKAIKVKVLARAETVFRASAQDLAAEMVLPGPSKRGPGQGGNMRVDTGFLRNSQVASLTEMPRVDPARTRPEDAKPNSFGDNLNSVNLVIAGAGLGDTIYIGFTASYAAPREAYDQYVALAGQNWRQIVASNVEKAKAANP